MDIKGANFVLTLSEEVRLIHILLRRVREGKCGSDGVDASMIREFFSRKLDNV